MNPDKFVEGSDMVCTLILARIDNSPGTMLAVQMIKQVSAMISNASSPESAGIIFGLNMLSAMCPSVGIQMADYIKTLLPELDTSEVIREVEEMLRTKGDEDRS